MRHLTPWFAAGAIVAACQPATEPTEFATTDPSSTTSSLTEVTRTEEVVFSGPISSACVGEIVELHLRQQVLFHISFDATGGRHLHFSIADQGSFGIGLTSGTKYRFAGALKESSNSQVSFPEGQGNVVFVTNQVLTGKGRKFVIQQFFRFVFNARGELVSVKIVVLRIKQCTAGRA